MEEGSGRGSGHTFCRSTFRLVGSGRVHEKWPVDNSDVELYNIHRSTYYTSRVYAFERGCINYTPQHDPRTSNTFECIPASERPVWNFVTKNPKISTNRLLIFVAIFRGRRTSNDWDVVYWSGLPGRTMRSRDTMLGTINRFHVICRTKRTKY